MTSSQTSPVGSPGAAIPTMHRIDGDNYVAVAFEGVKQLIQQAIAEMRGGELADRCIYATQTTVRAQMVFNRALADLEVVTGIPWTAIPIQPDICKGDAGVGQP